MLVEDRVEGGKLVRGEFVYNCRCGSPKAKLAIIRGTQLVAYQVGEFGAGSSLLPLSLKPEGWAGRVKKVRNGALRVLVRCL